MKALINLRQERLTKILYKKTNFKKVGFSTIAFMAKILSRRFRHLNIVGCLLKRRSTKGGSRAPKDPPPLATPLLRMGLGLIFKYTTVFLICYQTTSAQRNY